MNAQLFAAAKNGNVNEVRRLLPNHAATEQQHHDADGMMCLHYASMNGDIEMARYLIEEAGCYCDVEWANKCGYTALHLACENGRPSMVRYLVENAGANVEARHMLDMTPLHIASFQGCTNMVKYLVETAQANVDAKDCDGNTPLDGVVCGDRKCFGESVARFLLPRTSSVVSETLASLWTKPSFIRGAIPHDDIRRMVLEKYAFGRGLASDFLQLPIHTVISHFPLPSTMAYQECIALFPVSVLSLLDEQGRLPIHVAFSSSSCRRWIRVRSHWEKEVIGPSFPVVRTLFEREPRSALTRDPTTGLYPHETAAGLSLRDDDGWLDVVYAMFRSNPQQLLQSRRVGWETHELLASSEEVHVVDEGPTAKTRAKIENKF